MTTLTTARLVMREWRDADLAPFAALNADAEVMRWFTAPLEQAESDAVAARIRARFDANGYGLWAVEVPGVTPFAGYVGLHEPAFTAHFTRPDAPCLEIGWRLAREHWGRGYASEAALALRDHGFAQLGFTRLISLILRGNERSERVAEKIGSRYVRDVSRDAWTARLFAVQR